MGERNRSALAAGGTGRACLYLSGAGDTLVGLPVAPSAVFSGTEACSEFGFTIASRPLSRARAPGAK